MAAQGCLDPEHVSNFVSKNTNVIHGRIAQVLSRKVPYVDILAGETIDPTSDTIRSVVQEPAVLGTSLAAPTFTDDILMCAGTPNQDQVGNTEYSWKLQSYRGKGPMVCVKTSRTAFKGSLAAAQMALEKNIAKLRNADVRNVLHKRSGVKFVCNSSYRFSDLLTGDMQYIDTKFADITPNAPVSFKTLEKLGSFLREEMMADPFVSDNGEMFRVIGSYDAINRLREETGVKEDMRAFVSGKYAIGEKTLNSYIWSGPYKGFGFAVDSQPLRATANLAGDLELVEPTIAVNVTNGVAERRNPAWVTAPFEVMFLIASDPFAYVTPTQYTGEASFKFSPQITPGTLTWRYIIDNCNPYGDFGYHIYEVIRGYRPTRPHNVIPIVYQRCEYDLGLVTCASSSSGL